MSLSDLDMGTMITFILAVVGPLVAFLASSAVIRSRVDEHREQLKELWTWRDDTFARQIRLEEGVSAAREDINRMGQNMRRLDDRITTHFNGVHHDNS